MADDRVTGTTRQRPGAAPAGDAGESPSPVGDAARPGWRHLVLPVPGADPIDAFRWDSGRPGPVLAVLGGVHGDEPEGVLAADALTRLARPADRGALIVVPVAHPAACAAHTRCCPAGGNLARAFPGDPDGSPAARTAAVLAREVLMRADALIDLHTAGRDCDMPLLAGYGETGDAGVDAVSRRMARDFGADFLWRHAQTAPGRTLSVMAARGKPAIYAEAAGGGALHGAALARYGDGLAGAMAALGMRDAAPHPGRDPICVAGPGNLDADAARAPCAGFFAAGVAAGDAVRKGQIAGRIMAPGHGPVDVTAPQAGRVMFLRHHAPVVPGTPVLLTAMPDAEGA